MCYCPQLEMKELTFTPTLISRVLIKYVYWLTSNRKQNEPLSSCVSHQKLSLKVSGKSKIHLTFHNGKKKIKACYIKGMWVCNDNKYRSHRNVFTNVNNLLRLAFPRTHRQWNVRPSTGTWHNLMAKEFFLNFSLKDNVEALEPNYNIPDKASLP